MNRAITSFSLALTVATAVPSAAAASITFTPAAWSVGETVHVSGSDLKGDYPDRALLCLAPEAAPDKRSCFGGYGDDRVWDDDEYITGWDDTEIEFTVPAEAPPKGVIILVRSFDEEKCFGSAGCDEYAKEQTTNLGTYSARPLIGSISDDSQVAPALALRKGQRYEIRGAVFGDEKGFILVGQPVQARTGRSYANWVKLPPEDIVSWGATVIRIVPSQDIALSVGLKVHNGAAESNTYSAAGGPAASLSSSLSSSRRVTGSAGPTLFTDVAADAHYAEAVAWAKGAGVVSGYPDGSFRPDRPVNRVEFLKMVFAVARLTPREEGDESPSFTDVDDLAWYMPYVRAAREAGVVKGYPDGTFRPEQAVSFAEGLKMGYLALEVDAPETGGEWYERYLRQALANGVLYDTTVDVGAGMTRKEVAWMVWKLSTGDRSAQDAPTKSSSSSSVAQNTSVLQFGDGTFIVGKDIQPGTYRTRAGSANCYFSRLSGFSGELKDILANENTDDPVIVTIASGDAGFKSERCGTWTQDLSQITTSKTSFGDGMFIVGSDIEPGTYRNTGAENCYYARLSGFSHSLKEIIANENADTPAIVRIDARDVGFSSSRCGVWTKQY